MSVQDDVNKIRTAMKLIWEVANDNGLDCMSLYAMPHPETAGEEPFAVTQIKETQFMFHESDGFSASYIPLDEMDSWVCGYDPARVVSFSMPPEKTEPRSAQQGSTDAQDSLSTYRIIDLDGGKINE